MTEDLQKLLSGYSANNLTPEDRDRLFAAALEDQELFDALAHEEAVRDILADPAAKREVLAVLAPAKKPWFRMPWYTWAGAAAVAAMAVVGVVLVRQPATQLRHEQEVAVAKAPSSAAADTKPDANELRPQPAQIARKHAAKAEGAGGRAVRQEPRQDAQPPAISAAPPPPPPPPPAPAARAPAESQSTLSTIQGVVRDNAGSAIEGAQVRVRNAETGDERKTETSKAGEYAVNNLPSGPYTVTVEAQGFKQLKRTVDQVRPAAPVQVPATLEVGSVSEAVDVSAAAPAVKPELVTHTILRQAPDGSFVSLKREEKLHSGDTIRIQFQSNATGQLSVREGTKIIFTGLIEAKKPLLLPAEGGWKLENGPGSRKLSVSVAPPAVFNLARTAARAATAGGRMLGYSFTVEIPFEK